MSAAPLAAVCTPVFNGAKYLAETMACVQAQTYPNVVHVVLDNASTDETPKIIESFQGGPVPILLARNPATVPAFENMNRVIRMQPAETRYFRMLCADDLMMPDALARMIAIMERDRDVDLVTAAEPDPKWQGWPPGDVFDGLTMAAAYLRDELPTSFAHSVFRRGVFERRAPDFFDPRINSRDVDVGLDAMCRSKVGYVHEPLVVTREHDASISARDMWETRIHYAEWLVLLSRYGPIALGEEETKRVARRFKRPYFRRMLRWRLLDRQGARVRQHLERLDLARARPTPLDYGDAVLDWVLTRSGLRPRWSNFRY
jgi:glycosyltransferase involved in cell wall biosynthesis